MTPPEVERALKQMTVLVDTREQPTALAEARWRSFGVPHRRQKLDFGDYSAEFQTDDGVVSLSGCVTVERKMSLDELANCYCSQRERFTREFERAREAGARVYLLVECGSWEKAFSGDYRSRMAASSMVASMCTWMARYDCPIVFCTPRMTGKLVAEILRKEGRERMLDGRLDKDTPKTDG